MENMLLDTSTVVFTIMLALVLMITLGIFCIKSLSYVDRELRKISLTITYIKNMCKILKETTEVMDSSLEELHHKVNSCMEERRWEDGI